MIFRKKHTRAPPGGGPPLIHPVHSVIQKVHPLFFEHSTLKSNTLIGENVPKTRYKKYSNGKIHLLKAARRTWGGYSVRSGAPLTKLIILYDATMSIMSSDDMIYTYTSWMYKSMYMIAIHV